MRVSPSQRPWFRARGVVVPSLTFNYLTHLTLRGVWGDEVSPEILFSPRGAGYARAAWEKKCY